MLTIRPEQPGDAGRVRAVVTAAFPTDAEAQLVDALRAAGQLTVSLVALDGDEVVGHVAFSPVTVAGRDGGLGLAPVAVAPGWQRQGVGSQLVRDGLLRAEATGAGYVVVLGAPAYYGRFGFAAASRWGLSDEYGGGEAFQVLEFRPGAAPAGGGLVRYAPAFAAFA